MMNDLQRYVDVLQRGEPLASVLIGDGEFLVAMRECTGRALQNGEVVTEQMEREMTAAIADPRLLKGTDLNLINWRGYAGRNFDSIREIGEKIERFLASLPGPPLFVDGVVWDRAAREGGLAPLLRWMSRADVTLVANDQLIRAVSPWLRPGRTVAIPPRNAFAAIDRIEEDSFRENRPVIACMGLGAAPLAHRLIKRIKDLTFLDLGSTLDIFAGLGATRGWRSELYKDNIRWNALIAKNLEGVT